jgi:hypothetical protein
MTDTHSDTPWTLDTLRCATFYDLTQSVLGSVPGMAKEQAQQVAQKYIERTFATAAREELAVSQAIETKQRQSGVSDLLLGGALAATSFLGIANALTSPTTIPAGVAVAYTVIFGAGQAFGWGALAVGARDFRRAKKAAGPNKEAAQKISAGPEGLATYPLSEERYAHVERTVKDKILALRQGTAQLTL